MLYRHAPVDDLEECHLGILGAHATILIIRGDNRAFPFAGALHLHNIGRYQFPQHLSVKMFDETIFYD